MVLLDGETVGGDSMKRGEIVIECDSPLCGAEIIYEAEDISKYVLDDMLGDDEWKVLEGGRFACPDCVLEQEL